MNEKEKTKNEKIKKRWKIVLFIDLIPIVGLIILGIYYAFNGFWLFMAYYKGIDAFIISIWTYCVFFFPITAIVVFLLFFSIIKIIKLK